jgi:MFS family permease
MAAGLFISSTGASMIWPFLMIYVSEKLQLSLSTVASLISINAATGLATSFIGGAVADRLGRKPVMVVSLMANGLVYFFLSRAGTYLDFAILMMLAGASNPLYQIGADAMLADMIVPENRTQAYAIVRMVNNAGIAFGPAIGGFAASLSYAYAFGGAATGMVIYSLLMLLRGQETLPKTPVPADGPAAGRLGGYGRVFGDRPYMLFAAIICLGLITPSMLWNLLAVYTKQNFGLSESLFGWIPTTNALMCVFVQFFVTRVTSRHRPLPVMTVGLVVYTLGVGSVVLMKSFWGFWSTIVLFTFGELILIPTISKFIADRAPADMRGRYMSVYWFAWGLARGIAPLLGGWLNDAVAPRAIWIGGMLVGLVSAAGLVAFSRRHPERKPALALE